VIIENEEGVAAASNPTQK